MAKDIAKVNLAAGSLFNNISQVIGNALELNALTENLRSTLSRFKIRYGNTPQTTRTKACMNESSKSDV